MLLRKLDAQLFIALCLFLVVNIALANVGETSELLQQYVRLNTSNPPGNEIEGARFFADIFEKNGIPYEIVESSPGRANIWARLEGGDQPGVLLLHHMDVVPADPSRWRYPPFEATVAEGRVHGRGTLDNKSTGIFHLQAFLALHRAGRPLTRDVIFMATADEEAGGQQGVGWLMEHRPDLFEHIGAVLNEGSSGNLRNGQLSFGVEITQKLPLWIKITAEGTPGHGAVPRQGSAPQRLVRALSRLETLQFEARAIPVVAEYLQSIAKDAPPPWNRHLASAPQLAASSMLMSSLQTYDHRLHALLTTTCALTRLAGSGKINVVPPSASAEVDCRLLPDEEPADVLAVLRENLAGDGITVEPILSFGPGSSSTDNFLYRAIKQVLSVRYPHVPVLPKMNAGFTDSHFFREKEIAAYGFTPVILTRSDGAGVHGDNENISLKNLKLGGEMTLEVLQEIVYD